MSAAILKRLERLEAAKDARKEDDEAEWRSIHATAEIVRAKLGLPPSPFVLPAEPPPRTEEEWEEVRRGTYAKLGLIRGDDGR